MGTLVGALIILTLPGTGISSAGQPVEELDWSGKLPWERRDYGILIIQPPRPTRPAQRSAQLPEDKTGLQPAPFRILAVNVELGFCIAESTARKLRVGQVYGVWQGHRLLGLLKVTETRGSRCVLEGSLKPSGLSGGGCRYILIRDR